MLIESIKAAMCEIPCEKEAAVAKYSHVVRFLLGVACCTGFEAVHADIVQIADILGLDDELVNSEFVPRAPLSFEAKASVQIPNYVAALNSGGSAFLVQASVGGSSAFFCNDDMSAAFVSAHEAESIYAASSSDPDAVMRRLVAPRDRLAYLSAMTDLLVRQHDLLGETSLIVHVNARRGPPVLCLVQLRSSFHGDVVVFGAKFIPMPSSDYLPPTEPLLAPAPFCAPPPMPMGSFLDPSFNPLSSLGHQALGGLYPPERASLAKRKDLVAAPQPSKRLAPAPDAFAVATGSLECMTLAEGDLEAFPSGFAGLELEGDPALANFAMGIFGI
jgi:hypothetical protein